MKFLEKMYDSQKAVMIITNEREEIAGKIFEELGRTVAILEGQECVRNDQRK